MLTITVPLSLSPRFSLLACLFYQAGAAYRAALLTALETKVTTLDNGLRVASEQVGTSPPRFAESRSRTVLRSATAVRSPYTVPTPPRAVPISWCCHRRTIIRL